MQSCQKKERLLVGLHCNCLRTMHMCFAPAAQQLPHYTIHVLSCLKLSLYTLHILSWQPALCVCIRMRPSCQTALTLHSTCSQLFDSFHCTHYIFSAGIQLHVFVYACMPAAKQLTCMLLCTLQLPSSSHITYTSAVKPASCLQILLHVFQLPSSFLACHMEVAVACAVHVAFQQLTI
jgi:hypothetical protein